MCKLSGRWRLRVQSRSRRQSTIAASVDYRGFCCIYISCLFSRDFRHDSTTITRLSLVTGLGCGGRVILPARGCEIWRDRALQSHCVSQKAFSCGRGVHCRDNVQFNQRSAQHIALDRPHLLLVRSATLQIKALNETLKICL